jgi:hypothetical protein
VFGQRTPVGGQGRNEGVLHPLRARKAKGCVNRPANSWPNPRLTAKSSPLCVLGEKHGCDRIQGRGRLGVKVSWCQGESEGKGGEKVKVEVT